MYASYEAYCDSYRDQVLREEYYDQKMQELKDEAIKKVEKDLIHKNQAKFFAEALALAFFEMIDDSQVMFDRYDLSFLDAYALLDMKDRFVKEYERINY